MTEKYRYRQYRDGDAAAINDLYADITGRTRSLREFDWQWLHAPGGRGEIWLIEATNKDGATDLIGHHGIMPIRFSRGEENLLFGKTENTMLRPEYRKRILYPRYERRFARVYEPRFDALFSTVGPAAAIRLRRAMGYTFSSKWVRLQIPTSWAAEMVFAYCICRDKLVDRERRCRGSSGGPESGSLARPGCGPLELRALNDSQARCDPFFDAFWPQCRVGHGLTPRRDREDLDWRFWSNPNTSNITLVSDERSDEPGYVIIRRSNSRPEEAVIEDIVPCNADAEKFYRLLDSALSWMRSNKIYWAGFTTTHESCASNGIAAGITGRDLLFRTVVRKIRNDPVSYMPRKITATGSSKGLDLHNWYVTPLVFEGRAS